MFGNVSIHLTRMRLIKDTTASEEEVDVNFDAHNNQNDILNLDGYHFQVVTNGQYDWVDQNNFQYGYIAPHSDMQEYFVAHMGIGYTEPITLVISKDGVTKSIVVTKPEITSAPPSSPTVGTDPTDPFRNLFKR